MLKNRGAWLFDSDTKEHYLPVSETKSWKVYKSAAGDYVRTLHDDEIGHGEDVEYVPTLLEAKSRAEQNLPLEP